MADRLEYIANCIDRVLMADCAPSEFRRRSEAIAKAIRVAHERGMIAAHEYMQMLVAEAEAGGFAKALQPAVKEKK